MALGVDDEVFWESTPSEVAKLTKALIARYEAEEKAMNIRAGTIAATIVNVAPRRSRRVYNWTDFFRSDEQFHEDSPDALRHALIVWGESTRGVKLQ